MGQAASFNVGTITHSSSAKQSTINHTFERCSQAIITIGYNIRGSWKGSTFAHSAGVKSDKKSKAMMTDNNTVQQSSTFAPPAQITHKQTKSYHILWCFCL
mmetsp:Transcript_8183/g.9527  ORF Transcript_8183/g.9527 Transcript_8183/m.9527 type:complete len:101 (+) Transcript_8183:659-961(+)